MKPSPSIGPTFCVRHFQRQDADQVRELFRVSIGYEPGSVRSYALRGTLTRPKSLLCYALILTGLYTAYKAPSYNQPRVMLIGGLTLSALSALFFLFHWMQIGAIFRRHSDPANHPDMDDIGVHYGVVMRPDGTSFFSGKSGFWVADCLSEEGKLTGKVVGCVGLDARYHPDPNNVELRRMAVSSTMQRKGVGRHLLEAVLHHVKEHNLTSITLETSAYSPSAKGIYERFGWKLTGKTSFPGKPWLDARVVKYKLDV